MLHYHGELTVTWQNLHELIRVVRNLVPLGRGSIINYNGKHSLVKLFQLGTVGEMVKFYPKQKFPAMHNLCENGELRCV